MAPFALLTDGDALTFCLLAGPNWHIDYSATITTMGPVVLITPDLQVVGCEGA